MPSKFIRLQNFYDTSLPSVSDITGVEDVKLQKVATHELSVVRLNPHQKQALHYHSYAEIDVFIVVSGSGYLHLGKVQEGQLVFGTEEKISLKEGDTYCVGPSVLHGVEAGLSGLSYVNLAHATHGVPVTEKEKNQAYDTFFL